MADLRRRGTELKREMIGCAWNPTVQYRRIAAWAHRCRFMKERSEIDRPCMESSASMQVDVDDRSGRSILVSACSVGPS
jgi:hypothetical protein